MMGKENIAILIPWIISGILGGVLTSVIVFNINAKRRRIAEKSREELYLHLLDYLYAAYSTLTECNQGHKSTQKELEEKAQKIRQMVSEQDDEIKNMRDQCEKLKNALDTAQNELNECRTALQHSQKLQAKEGSLQTQIEALTMENSTFRKRNIELTQKINEALKQTEEGGKELNYLRDSQQETKQVIMEMRKEVGQLRRNANEVIEILVKTRGADSPEFLAEEIERSIELLNSSVDM